MNTSTLSSHSVKPKDLARYQTCASCIYLQVGNVCFMYFGLNKKNDLAYAVIPHPTQTAKCRRAE